MLIDFGLSTRRGSPSRGGTPGLKPVADKIYDQDSDVYSFGKTLQQLAGRLKTLVRLARSGDERGLRALMPTARARRRLIGEIIRPEH